MTTWVLWLVHGVMVWSLWLSTLTSTAATPPTSVEILRDWQQQIEAQQETISAESDRLSELEEAAQIYLDVLQSNIQQFDGQVEDYDGQIQRSEKHLQQLEKQLAQERKRYQPKLAATIARLRFLQRQSNTHQGWDLLLNSEDLNEFVDRRERLKLLYQADRKSLLELQQAAKQIQLQAIRVEQEKNQISLLKQQLLTQQNQDEAQITLQRELIARLNGDRQALKAAQAKLNVDSDSLGNLIRQRIIDYSTQNPDQTALRGNGKFIFPCKGEITSQFGWRRHPIYGSRRRHTGVDFGGSYGDVIEAADSGTVIFARWYGGYGRTVIIDHGNGLTSLYGHSSKLYVQEGNTVNQGAAIAAIGSSGLATGPHLHFEIRKNGQPVNPMNYLLAEDTKQP